MENLFQTWVRSFPLHWFAFCWKFKAGQSFWELAKQSVWNIICSFGLKQVTPETAFGSDLPDREKNCIMNEFETLWTYSTLQSNDRRDQTQHRCWSYKKKVKSIEDRIGRLVHIRYVPLVTLSPPHVDSWDERMVSCCVFYLSCLIIYGWLATTTLNVDEDIAFTFF